MESDMIPNGIKLTRNELGGLSVVWNGNLIGWMHATIGESQWTAYIPGNRPIDRTIRLGRYPMEEAVRRIAREAGWKPSE